MSDIPFYKTRMGHTFYGHTVPELVRQLTRLNDLLEQVVAEIDRGPAPDGDQHRGDER